MGSYENLVSGQFLINAMSGIATRTGNKPLLKNITMNLNEENANV